MFFIDETAVASQAGTLLSRLRSKCYSVFNYISRLTERFWLSRAYFPFMLLVTIAFLAMDQQVAGAAALLSLCIWFLMTCPDFLASVCPFCMAFLMSAPEYRDLSVFLPIVPLGMVWLVALVLHLVTWPKPIRIGRESFALLLVALATIFGGCDILGWDQFTSPLSLYYTLGLGVGMLAVYVLMRSQLAGKHSYDLKFRFAKILYTIGMGMAAVIFVAYAYHWDKFTQTGAIFFMKYRNYAATVLLMTLPMPFYFALRNRLHLLPAGVMALALFLTGSRSGLLFGGILLMLCVGYLMHYHVIPGWVVLGVSSACVAALLIFGNDWFLALFGKRMAENGGKFISADDTRWKMLWQALVDFVEHPVFGVGIGNIGNLDHLYVGVPGSMAFYHNAVAQIFGSMGIVGAIAYGRLLMERVSLLWANKNPFTVAMALSYGAMLMVSMTNPGIFCPFPNAALMVMLFATVEEVTGDATVRLPQLMPRKIGVRLGWAGATMHR